MPAVAPAGRCYRRATMLEAWLMVFVGWSTLGGCGASRAGDGPPPALSEEAAAGPSAGTDPRVERAIETLASLESDGWLEQFRSGRCRLLDLDAPPTEAGAAPVESEAAPSAETDAPPDDGADVIGDLAAVEGTVERSPACTEAATRFAELRRIRDELAWDAAAPGALGALRRQMRALTGIARDAQQCPQDDPDLPGAVLAVARYRADLALTTPVRLHQADRTCWVSGLGGAAWLDEEGIEARFAAAGDEAQALDEGEDLPSGVAVDWVYQMCWRGIDGRDDGCLRTDSTNARTSELASNEPGTVTVFIALERAAVGCDSVAIRSYEVARLGGPAGRWRVRRETLVSPGNHGQ